MQIEYILDKDIFDESIREIAKKKVVLDISAGAGSPFRKKLSKYKPFFKRCSRVMETFLEKIINLFREHKIDRLHNPTGFKILIKK